jgi:TonB family protein
MVEAFRKYWHADQDELYLLLDLRDDDAPRRERVAIAGALVAQIAIIAALFYAPMSPGTHRRFFPEIRLDMGQSTTVFVPRDVIESFQLTQKAPQTKAPATEVNLEKLLPRTGRETSAAPGPPALAGPAPRTQPQPFTPPTPEPAPAQRASIDPPRVEPDQRSTTPNPTQQDLAPNLPPPPSQPKLILESLPSPSAPSSSGPPRLLPPSSRPMDAARAAARAQSSGRMTVGDADITGGGGVGEMARQTPSPGAPGSALELLSDPLGVDFKPYLVQILARVRRNWMAVMPESARFGQRGRTIVQFSIDRAGSIPKVGIVTPSGIAGLDRAAVAGLTSSVPFPPLPPEFKGREIRLQFVFSYNMPAK